MTSYGRGPAYFGRRTPLPSPRKKHNRKLTDTGHLDHSVCYLHGGKYERVTCPGCVEVWESEEEFAAVRELMDGEDF